MTEYYYLFSSIVGSHMWKMNRPDSDIDLNVVYMADSNDILAGDHVKRADEMIIESTSGSPKFDIHMYEIGHLIHLLKKGNVNAIWAVCSPMKTIPDSGRGDGVCDATSISILRSAMDVKFEGKFDGMAYGFGKNAQHRLEEIVRSNLSRFSYHSIEGMSYSQYLDADKHPERALKTLKTCIRTCQFGIKLLTDGELVFDAVKFSRVDDARGFAVYMRENLDVAYKNSPLPDMPDEERFRSFLLDLRTDPIGVNMNERS